MKKSFLGNLFCSLTALFLLQNAISSYRNDKCVSLGHVDLCDGEAFVYIIFLILGNIYSIGLSYYLYEKYKSQE